MHWEQSLLIAESVQALCEGELVAWNQSVPRTALTVEQRVMLCQCLGPCPGPLWLPSALAHMPLTLGHIQLFLQPFLEFLAWIFVLFFLSEQHCQDLSCLLEQVRSPGPSQAAE